MKKKSPENVGICVYNYGSSHSSHHFSLSHMLKTVLISISILITWYGCIVRVSTIWVCCLLFCSFRSNVSFSSSLPLFSTNILQQRHFNYFTIFFLDSILSFYLFFVFVLFHSLTRIHVQQRILFLCQAYYISVSVCVCANAKKQNDDCVSCNRGIKTFSTVHSV